MLAWICTLLLASAARADGPAEPFTITATTLAWEATSPDVPFALQKRWAGGSIVMPYLSGSDPLVATRINQAVFLDVLGKRAPDHPDAQFRLADAPPLTPAIRFKTARNDGRVLVLEIEEVVDPGHTDVTSYNFDARTGRKIGMEDLFSHRGLLRLAQRTEAERIDGYVRMDTELAQKLKALDWRRDDAVEAAEQLRETRDFNRACLRRARTSSATEVALSLADAQAVTVHAGRCERNAHPLRDPVGPIVFKFLPERSMLTRYGRAVLLGEGAVSPPRDPFNQILHGKLGREPITMRLQRHTEKSIEVAGHFFRESDRAPIQISGEIRHSHIELNQARPPRLIATFDLVQRGTGFTGTYRPEDGPPRSVSVHW